MKQLTAGLLLLSAIVFLALFGLPDRLEAFESRTALRISEVMESNQYTVRADDGKSYDWIEIENYGKSPVQLLDYGLSDDAKEPFKWRFPDITLKPGDYLIVWASGKDSDSDKELHANFSLKAGKEIVLLTQPNNVILSSVATNADCTDFSYGFNTDTGSYVWFPQPTPGSANSPFYQNLASDSKSVSMPVFSTPPGFYETDISLEITADNNASIYYTLDGSMPTEESFLYTGQLLITSSTNPNRYAGLPDISYTTSSDSTWGRPAGKVFRGTVVRAVAYIEGKGLSETANATYLIDPKIQSRFDLPVISLATDPDNLFDYETGIYVTGKTFDDAKVQYPQGDTPANYNQRGSQWERPVNMSYFSPDGTLMFSQDLGVRTHGAWSRSNPHKGLRLFADEEYGSDILNYPLFSDLTGTGTGASVTAYHQFLLRASGNDWSYTMFRDALMQGLIKDLPRVHDLDTQSYQPTVVFINGEYWGIHNLRETVDTDTLSAHYGIIEKELSIVEYDNKENTYVIDTGDAGEADDYNNLIQYVNENDLSLDAAYAYVSERVDLENFALYMAAQTYYGNTDWPGNNIRIWRAVPDRDQAEPLFGQDGKWRYMLFDTDFGFHIYEGMENGAAFDSLAFAAAADGPDWPNPPSSTALFKNLLKNDSFRTLFVNTYADMLNTTLQTESILDAIDAYVALLDKEMPYHIRRYSAIGNWDYEVQRLRDFAKDRTGFMWNLLQSSYSLDAPCTITLDISDSQGGTLQLNGMYPLEWAQPYKGTYFKNIPVTVTAMPKDGYIFTGWAGRKETASTLTLLPEDGLSLIAVFEKEN